MRPPRKSPLVSAPRARVFAVGLSVVFLAACTPPELRTGESRFDQERWEEAVKYLESGLEKKPGKAWHESLLSVARSMAADNRFQRASTRFAAEEPDAAREEAEMALSFQRKHKGAQNLIDRISALQKDRNIILGQAGRLNREGQHDRAFDLLEPYYSLGKERSEFREEFDLARHSSHAFHMEAGRRILEQQDYDGAVGHFSFSFRRIYYPLIGGGKPEPWRDDVERRLWEESLRSYVQASADWQAAEVCADARQDFESARFDRALDRYLAALAFVPRFPAAMRGVADTRVAWASALQREARQILESRDAVALAHIALEKLDHAVVLHQDLPDGGRDRQRAREHTAENLAAIGEVYRDLPELAGIGTASQATRMAEGLHSALKGLRQLRETVRRIVDLRTRVFVFVDLQGEAKLADMIREDLKREIVRAGLSDRVEIASGNPREYAQELMGLVKQAGYGQPITRPEALFHVLHLSGAIEECKAGRSLGKTKVVASTDMVGKAVRPNPAKTAAQEAMGRLQQELAALRQRYDQAVARLGQAQREHKTAQARLAEAETAFGRAQALFYEFQGQVRNYQSGQLDHAARATSAVLAREIEQAVRRAAAERDQRRDALTQAEQTLDAAQREYSVALNKLRSAEEQYAYQQMVFDFEPQSLSEPDARPYQFREYDVQVGASVVLTLTLRDGTGKILVQRRVENGIPPRSDTVREGVQRSDLKEHANDGERLMSPEEYLREQKAIVSRKVVDEVTGVVTEMHREHFRAGKAAQSRNDPVLAVNEFSLFMEADQGRSPLEYDEAKSFIEENIHHAPGTR